MNRKTAKRCFDLALALPGFLAVSPVLAAVALLIKLFQKGPVFFYQTRPGLDGRPFRIVKFRTMSDRRDSRGNLLPDADRLTALGKMLRATSLDELPELINVVKGDMSLVGPRPERPYFVDQLTKQIPFYAVRHSVKPGVTGWAQVRYAYGASVDDAARSCSTTCSTSRTTTCCSTSWCCSKP